MQNGDMFAGACLDNDEKLVYTMYIQCIYWRWIGCGTASDLACCPGHTVQPQHTLFGGLRGASKDVETKIYSCQAISGSHFPHLSRFKTEETWMEVTCDDYSWNILKLLWSLVALNATCRKVRWCSLYFLLLWQRCALRFSSLWASVLSPFG